MLVGLLSRPSTHGQTSPDNLAPDLGKEIMINLLESVTIIHNNSPESVATLYDVLLFMAAPEAVLSSDYNEAVEFLYARTKDSRAHRKLYEESRAA